MYSVHVTNGSQSTLTTSDGKQVPPNGTWDSGTIGNAWIASPEGGTLSFHDLGDKRIGGDTKETWGVLISYQGEEIVGRYEGGGQLQVALNAYFQATLSGMQLRRVFLPSLIVQGESSGDQVLEAEEASAST